MYNNRYRNNNNYNAQKIKNKSVYKIIVYILLIHLGN